MSQLVYAAGREQVRHVWIGGRQVLKNRALTTIDLAQTLQRATAGNERIVDNPADPPTAPPWRRDRERPRLIMTSQIEQKARDHVCSRQCRPCRSQQIRAAGLALVGSQQ